LTGTCFNFKLEQFWHGFASRGFVSDSWAFLYSIPCSVLHWTDNKPLSGQFSNSLGSDT